MVKDNRIFTCKTPGCDFSGLVDDLPYKGLGTVLSCPKCKGIDLDVNKEGITQEKCPDCGCWLLAGYCGNCRKRFSK